MPSFIVRKDVVHQFDICSDFDECVPAYFADAIKSKNSLKKYEENARN